MIRSVNSVAPLTPSTIWNRNGRSSTTGTGSSASGGRVHDPVGEQRGAAHSVDDLEQERAVEYDRHGFERLRRSGP